MRFFSTIISQKIQHSNIKDNLVNMQKINDKIIKGLESKNLEIKNK